MRRSLLIGLALITSVCVVGCKRTPAASGTPSSADSSFLAPEVDPLPEAEVGILFEKIDKGEEIAQAELYQALKGPQTTLRAYAARELGKYGDESSVPYLIDALSDESVHVGATYPKAGMMTTRYWANDSLTKLTGQDFGFVWNDPVEKRNAAIARWRTWFSADVMPASRPPVSSGEQANVVVLANYRDKTYQEMYNELGAPSDKTGYTIANAPTKGWNHGELFSTYPRNDANTDIQIMEVTWDSGDFTILACYHMVNGKNRCLVAKRVRKGVKF